MLSGNMGHVITMREPDQVTTKVLVAIMPVVGRRLYSLHSEFFFLLMHVLVPSEFIVLFRNWDNIKIAH